MIELKPYLEKIDYQQKLFTSRKRNNIDGSDSEIKFPDRISECKAECENTDKIKLNMLAQQAVDDLVIIDNESHHEAPQISPREYDKALEKYLVKTKKVSNSSKANPSTIKQSKQSENTKQIIEKLLGKLDNHSNGESEALSTFYKQFSNNPGFMAKSFTARMEDDIIKRRENERNILKAEDRNRRDRFGNISKLQESDLVERLYKESFDRIISKSRLHTLYYHNQNLHSSMVNESVHSEQRASKRRIKEILLRLKKEDAKAEEHIIHLRKTKKSKDSQDLGEILNRNVSNGKMTLNQFKNVYSKIEQDIENRKRNKLLREETKNRLFEETLKGYFKPELSRSKQSLIRSKRAYSELMSEYDTFHFRRLDKTLETALSYFKTSSSEIYTSGVKRSVSPNITNIWKVSSNEKKTGFIFKELGEINDDLIPYKITQSSEKKKVKREIKNVEGISKTTIKQQNCGSNIKNNNKADSDKLKPNK